MAQSPLAAVFELKSTPIQPRRLWGTGLTTLSGLAVGLLLGHLEWGIWAFMGGFASLYQHNQPYTRRAGVLAAVGAGLALAMAIGAFSSRWWQMALALGFVSAGATYFCGVFDVLLPAGFMFVLVACISAALPLHPPGIVAVRVLCVLGGAAIAWVVGMMDWLWDRRGPAETPIATAFRALSRYVGAIGTHQQAQHEYHAALAVTAAHRAAWSVAVDSRPAMLAHQAEDVFRAAVALSSKESRPLPAEYRTVLLNMARHVGSPPTVPLSVKEAGPPKDPHWKRWRETLHRAIEVVNGRDVMSHQPHLYRPSVGERLRRGLSRDTLVRPAFLRIGLTVMAAVIIAHWMGIPHPYWVPLSCAAVLQGVSTVVITQRTVQRVIGTLLGLVLTGGLLALHPTPLLTAALVVVLQLLMLTFIAKNYGISVIFITAMALVIIYAGVRPPVLPLIEARLGDTILGSAIGLAAALLLWGRASSRRLPAALSAALNRTGALFEQMVSSDAPSKSRALRAQTLDSLLSVRHLYETALGELPRLPHDDLWPVIYAVERLGYLVVSICDSPHAQDTGLAKAMRPVFGALGARLGGDHDAQLPRIPPIPRYSAVEEQVWDLAEALAMTDPVNHSGQSS